MKLRCAAPLHLLGLAALRCASLRVPSQQRKDWLYEWRSELWHVRAACTPDRGFSWAAERSVAAFCFGAFEDARCLRREHTAGYNLRRFLAGSPTRCILALVLILCVSYSAARLLPGTAMLLHQPHYRNAQSLVLIQDRFPSSDATPTIAPAQYQTWVQRRQRLFDAFAFYQLSSNTLSDGQNQIANQTIAVASPNLFALLGQPIHLQSVSGTSAAPRLIVSYTLWRTHFGGDASILGRVVTVGATQATIAGIAPQGLWRLPGNVDAWLLVPNIESSTAPGFVIGRLNKSANYPRWSNSWHMTAPTPGGPSGDFECISLVERLRGPEGVFLFAILLACLALPATTSLPLGEYQRTSRKLSWSVRLRRWSFLATKLALLLPTVYFASLDLAHLSITFDPLTSVYIQLTAAFALCLFGLRWTLRDQRQRCPICLGRLTHPARVGQPSRNFLAWNGIELVCLGGHGLLHVPEISTSWFSTQRWLYLDPSWDILFPDPQLASANYF